jgi:hypothetical protein
MKKFRVGIVVVENTPGSRDLILYGRSHNCSRVVLDRGRKEYCGRNNGGNGKSQG